MSKRLFILLTSFVLVLGLVCNAGAQGTGTIMREVWSDIGGTAVSDLTGNANYPDNPTFGDELTLFEAPTDFADNFGSRVYGWLHPATSGDYTFWIAADDFCQISLSTDDDAANAVVIAGHNSWTGSREFDNMPEQMSAPIALEAGGKYYIEAIYKEGGGGDNMAVAWQGPDSPERSVIDGSFLSPAPWNIVLKRAKDPNPADGAIDADTASLEWAPGPSSVSYKVYLSTDATIEESELVAETDLTIHLAALDMGAAYWWRVDAVEADGTVIEGALWSFTTLPLEAHFPSPADGAKDIESGATLSWTAGKGVIMHDVYFGTDEAAVAAGDPSTFKGKVMVTSFDPGPLELFTTYYWKVDEFSVTGTNAGPVWSFSAPGYIVITSSETTLDYDNTADPFVSELALDVPADLRFGGVADLTLRFQGGAASEGSVSLDEATGTYSITGSGADIWGNSDQFHYGYRELTGDAVMIARVVDNGSGTNEWAKGGVMIRQSLDAGSTHRYMPITAGGGNGASFQGRPVADAGSVNVDSGEVVAPPYWVKLERVGNDFSGSISPDGVTWTQLGGAETVEMTDPVLIGLAVTSHQSGEKRTFTFDNVDIVGDISADDDSTDIGIANNAPAPVYVALEDSTGAVASVTHGNPAATNIESWRQWTIPLDKFEGVDASSAAKLYIGVGDGEPGGTGSITVDDVFVVKPDVTAGIASWEAAAAAASPGYIATNVADSLVDIGQYGGDQTYEFVVRSNPDETEASMALIGRRQFGDTEAGLKYEQWNNTGTYGATLFGVVDLDFGIANNPGVDTHLAFVSSVDASTTALYVNGVYQASVDRAISLSGLVGIGYGAQGADGSEAFDNFDGEVFGVAIYDAALSDAEIAANADAFFSPASDVTVPGDIVKGVPDDGDWPGGEYPALAIDDNTGTKYLHFKGETEPTGIKVTLLDGPSVVTGLSFTTANDATERDPISFELSGSNDSIDGPYTLIASGDIVDFAQEAAWPRFTKNETPISFANGVAYAHYQVMFPAVRDPGSANSMQIAEVELLTGAAPAGGANIIWVSGTYDDNGDGAPDDQEWVDLLTAAGHTVDYNGTYWRELDDDKIAALNAADLIIVSRNSNSGDYDDGDEPTQWNAVTTPIINSSTHIVRSSRWKWVDSTTILSLTPAMVLADGTEIPGINADVGPASFIDAAPGNGTVLATGDGLPFIIEWEAGVEYYDGAGQMAGGPRVCFVAGTQEDAATGVGRGEMNLSPEALAVFMDTVDRLLNPPPAPTIAWVSYHGADDEPHADAAAVGFTQAPDIEYTDLLKANGYNVVRVLTSQTPDVEFLNTMDLVIISRTASSGHYSGGGATLWNSVTAPMINLNGYTLRSSRLGFTDGTDMPDTTGDVRLTVTDPTHPIFAGIALTDGTMDNLYAEGAVPLPTDGTISRGISINNNNLDDEGTVLATIAEASADTGPVGGIVIAELPAGATMENSSGSPTDVLGGPRLVFLTGSREPSGVTGGQAAALYDLYPDGTTMLLNAVEYMLP